MLKAANGYLRAGQLVKKENAQDHRNDVQTGSGAGRQHRMT
jgi:hypothetical protein